VVLRRANLSRSAVWIGCLIPVGRLAQRWFLGDQLGANPIEELTHWSGLSALVILLASLAVTPARRLTGWNHLQKARRTLGLFAFFYASLHFVTYLWLDQFFAWSFIVEDIAERPFVLSGTAAFVCLVPLAVTSTRGWVRRLGRRWITLHRLAYAAAALALLHYVWKQKADFREPAIAGLVLGVLLAIRLVWWLRARRLAST
jgi:methionine sulfoxide reductase heme-binding subunit